MNQKILISSEVQPLFLFYYFVFVVLPFIYGVFFSDFRLHLSLFEPGNLATRLDGIAGQLLIMLVFCFGLFVFYNMEKLRFPQVRNRAWANVIYAVVGVAIYIILLGPDKTLTSFAVFAVVVVEVVAILVALSVQSIRENKSWRGKNRTDAGQKNLINSIWYGLLFMAYPVYIFYRTIPEVGNMRTVFIAYSFGLFIWKIVQADRFIST